MGRRVDDVNRRDLEASSLASWSRALDDQRRDSWREWGTSSRRRCPSCSGYAGGCSPRPTGDGQTEDVRRIRANAYVLLKRVEELLQVSRLDGGHLELEPRDVDVARLVRSSCEGFASVAELREQTLVVDSPPELPARLDEEKVLSVVSNLLANALKYAPAGGTVRCTVAGAGERMRIEVADSGPGVEDGLRETIFERYRRGAASATRPGGTGLGLAIVRDLVTLHNGTVTLTDAPEGGALFVVDLPVNVDGGADSDGARALPTIDVAERQRATVERLRAELDADGRRDAPALASEPGADRASILVVTRDSTRRLRGRAHRPALRRRPRGRRAGGRAPHRRRPPRRRRARRRRRLERDHRAAPAPRRGAAADARSLARRRARPAAGGRARLRGQAVRR